MPLTKAQKRECMLEAIKITVAYSGSLPPETCLEECYKKLCELQEDVEK